MVSTVVSAPITGPADPAASRTCILGGDHDELDAPDVSWVGRGGDVHDSIAADPFDPQAVRTDRLDVLLVGVDRRDVVTGGREQPRVHRPHGADAENADPHAG
jgi:hypothetical protein